MSNSLLKALHAIQLKSTQTKELTIRVHEEVDRDHLPDIYKKNIRIGSAHSSLNPEDNTINVGVRLSLGMDEEMNLPLSMRIEVVGTFTVDTENFPEDQLDKWAKQNAPFILFPFIRENAVALTTRCNLPDMILPLVQVPTLTIQKKKKKKKKQPKK